ncbi:hypothetical protein NQ318_006453 [Aromia moschata]|uniref:RNase H type-1 domain-containing protein n=1 Tax=Aromia moschata TaxID=1265417 RepID=A0AAV8XR32_9CUCU|nr:hypothetical protein NQ318_006453 [Aromia moschata]
MHNNEFIPFDCSTLYIGIPGSSLLMSVVVGCYSLMVRHLKSATLRGSAAGPPDAFRARTGEVRVTINSKQTKPPGHSAESVRYQDVEHAGLEILKTAPKRRTIQICTDSQAVLMAIESSKVKSRLVLGCKKILNDLASCNRVILTWVPGYSGVPGNEEADILARVGSIGYPIRPEPIFKGPYSMGLSTMKELLNKEFEKSWQEAPALMLVTAPTHLQRAVDGVKVKAF